MLNYRQLHYFWVVAKTGSIVRACDQLNLTAQTISGQISLLEQSLGVALFRKVGRRLALTEAGRQARSDERRVGKEGRARWSPDH